MDMMYANESQCWKTETYCTMHLKKALEGELTINFIMS